MNFFHNTEKAARIPGGVITPITPCMTILLLTQDYHKKIQVSILILCKILRKMHRKRLTAEKMLTIPISRRS